MDGDGDLDIAQLKSSYISYHDFEREVEAERTVTWFGVTLLVGVGLLVGFVLASEGEENSVWALPILLVPCLMIGALVTQALDAIRQGAIWCVLAVVDWRYDRSDRRELREPARTDPGVVAEEERAARLAAWKPVTPWLIWGYGLPVPLDSDAGEAARYALENIDGRLPPEKEIRWRLVCRLWGADGGWVKIRLDALVREGVAWEVIDHGFPRTYVLREGDLPEGARPSRPAAARWVYVEAWDPI